MARIIVKFHRGASEPGVQEVLRGLDLQVVRRVPALGVIVVEAPDAALAATVVRLNQDPLVEYAHPDMPLEPAFVNDFFFQKGDQWGVEKIRLPETWAESSGNPDLLIAVLDSGAEMDHPDLINKITRAKNFTAEPDLDILGHGTIVAGAAGAETDNLIGVAGAGFRSRMIVGKIIGAGVVEAAEAIVWATDQGARVINMSWTVPAYAPVLDDACQYAADRNVVLVAAAGNDFLELGEAQRWPAALDTVIGVAATDRNDALAGFSQRGAWVDLAAPGVDIKSTHVDQGYTSASGTSLAAPLVSGAAALLIAAGIVTRESVRQALVETSVGEYPLLAGRIDARAALMEWRLPVRAITRGRIAIGWRNTSFGATVEVVNAPDLSASRLDLDPRVVQVGTETVTALADVQNNGDAPGQARLFLNANTLGTAQSRFLVSDLFEILPGQTLRLGVAWTVGLTDGFYSITVAVEEVDESGGVHLLAAQDFVLTVEEPPAPNLVVIFPPDLAPTTVEQGGTVTATATLDNQGTAPGRARLYLSSIEPGLGPRFLDLLGDVPEIGLAEFTIDWTPALDPGSYEITVAIEELDPADDSFVRVLESLIVTLVVEELVEPAPDLRVTAGPTLSPTTIMTGDVVSASATVANLGDAVGRARLYLTATAPGAGPRFLTDTVNVVDGFAADLDISWTVNLDPGSYAITVAVEELDPVDNSFIRLLNSQVVTLTVEEEPPPPEPADLIIIAGPTLSPTTITQGDTVFGTARVENLGDETGRARLYLTAQYAGTGSKFRTEAKNVPGGAIANFQVSWIPALDPGSYQITVAVEELDLSGNFIRILLSNIVTLVIEAEEPPPPPSEPDLAVTVSPELLPLQAPQGSTVAAVAALENLGGATGRGRLYLSGQFSGGGSRFLTDTRDVPAGSEVNYGISWTVNLAPGVYSVTVAIEELDPVTSAFIRLLDSRIFNLQVT